MWSVSFAVCTALTLTTVGSARAEQISVPGTGDGMEMLRAVAAAYVSDNPGTSIVVPPSSGSGGGVIAVAQDKALLGRIAVPLSASEEAAGISAVSIVRLPLSFYAHASAGVSELTSAQLAEIFDGRRTNWTQLGGADLKIKVVRREEKDSTLVILRTTLPGWKELRFTDRSKLAVTTQDSLDTVRQTEGAIGFGPFSETRGHGFIVFKVDGKFPTDPDYPSFNRLRLIYKPATLTPEATKFIAFAKSEKAQQFYSNFGGVPETE
jgi:phosphate transport system substrate-binding protein